LPDNLTSATDVDPYATYDDLTLLSYLQHARLTSSPPCSANYSNLGFGVLGLVLERAYSRSWEALVQERISRPLGLVDTAQRLTDEQKGRLAQGWSGVQPARPWTFQAMAGAGALHSSAADLAKLADAILAGEKGPLGQAWALLSRAEVDAPGLGGKIGLALVHEQIDGVDGYSHGGATGGYAALMQAFPSSGQAYVVLASNSEAQPAAWLSSLRAESRPALERHEVSLPITLLDEYVGVYAFPPQAHFTVLRSDGGLLIRLTGQPFLPIYASAKDAFFYRAVDALISFQRDSEGKITGLVLHQNGRHLPATRTTDRVPQIVFPTPEVLAQYVGDYDFGSYIPGSSISVQASAGGLGVQISGQPMLPVFGTTRRDHFEYDVVPAALSFERDAAGRVIAVVLHQNGADMRAPRK
jgi:hypothetical protein